MDDYEGFDFVPMSKGVSGGHPFSGVMEDIAKPTLCHILQWVLVAAAIASLLVFIVFIIVGDKSQVIISLLVFSSACVFLMITQHGLKSTLLRIKSLLPSENRPDCTNKLW